jgi:hypothetical protein
MKGVAAATHMLLSGILRAARAIASALIGGNKWRSGTNLMVNGLWSGWERSSATEGTFLFRNFVRLFRNFVSRQAKSNRPQVDITPKPNRPEDPGQRPDDAQRRTISIRALICSPVASGSGGPPHARRSSACITPCGWPVR